MLYDEDGGADLGSHMQRLACQVAECFEPAFVYVIIKESDINTMHLDTREKQLIVEKDSQRSQRVLAHFVSVRSPHYDLKYLLKENELEISKRRHLVLKETE
jgi:hypothetical protein